MSLKIFQNLEGLWKFSRTVSSGENAVGKASFSRQTGTRLDYCEDGFLTNTRGEKVDFYKEYIYTLENDRILVLFKDLKLFHSLEFTTPTLATATHLCGCDNYQGTYHFPSPHQFQIAQVVKGPNKDYTITTLFNKEIPR